MKVYSLDEATELYRQHRRHLDRVVFPPTLSSARRGHGPRTSGVSNRAANRQTPGPLYREDPASLEQVAKTSFSDSSKSEETELKQPMATPARPNVQPEEFNVGEHSFNAENTNVTPDQEAGPSSAPGGTGTVEGAGASGGIDVSNNQFFRGFAKSSKRSDLVFTTMEKEYVKPIVYSLQITTTTVHAV